MIFANTDVLSQIASLAVWEILVLDARIMTEKRTLAHPTVRVQEHRKVMRMKKHAEKIIIAVILLLTLIGIGFAIFVHVKYGGKPITEVPAWAVKFFIER